MTHRSPSIADDTALTAGQVARLVGVSGHMVKKWCDSGQLPSFRLHRHRRVIARDLWAFLKANAVPLPEARRAAMPNKDQTREITPTTVLLPGEVCRALQVSPRTVGKWIDSGKLPGFRINQDRRVVAQDLWAFMRANNIPPPEGRLHAAICVTADSLLAVRLEEEFAAAVTAAKWLAGHHWQAVSDVFAAGMACEARRPGLVIVDFAIGDAAAGVCRTARELPHPLPVLAIAADGYAVPPGAAAVISRADGWLEMLTAARVYFDKLCSQAPTGFRSPTLTGRRPPYQKRSKE